MTDKHPDRWVVVKHGRVKSEKDGGALLYDPIEISLVRASNKTGRASWGWYHWDDKLLIAELSDQGRSNELPALVPELLALARRLCDERNEAERRRNPEVRKKVPRP